jgi:hypothetical protein
MNVFRRIQKPLPGNMIGTCRIMQSIGQGGIGCLPGRTDGEIKQKAAIKLLRAGTHRPVWCERFPRERSLLVPASSPDRPRHGCRAYR